ncbi:MAG: lipoprotein signal peptidase [Bacteroidaceae bacterium]|jgi:signal peptidase II|nr:lipoprotein signal peptidase [Bacteroidaceae bacterium]
MTRRQAQALTSVALAVGIVVVDQAIKVAVKTSMYLHQSIKVTDWFQILFTENDGMAFGMEVIPKWFLTSFRIAAVAVLTWYICRCVKRGIGWGYLVCLTMITAGAAGNIFDCVFYGMIFNNPPAPMVAELVHWGTGYGQLMLGRVVDMFYFPLVEWDWPASLPYIGGEHFIFFSPIFNFADASISCGVIALIIFHNKNVFR